MGGGRIERVAGQGPTEVARREIGGGHVTTWRRMRPYWQAIPQLLAYQVMTKVALAFGLAGLEALASWALASQGRVAVTSGDLAFLFTSSQGWLLILVGLAALYVYVAFDLNAKVALSGHIVRGEEVPLRQSMREGLSAIRRFLCPKGVLVVLYVALLAPIVGVGVGISLTEGLKIPTFISSVIEATPLYNVIYTATVVVLVIIGLLNIFCIHGVVLLGEDVGTARAHSSQIIRAHWKDYLVQTLLFELRLALAGGLVLLVFVAAPFAVAFSLGRAPETLRFWTILICLVGAAVGTLAGLLSTPFVLIKMTQLYYGYLEGERPEVPSREPRTSKLAVAAATIALAGCVGAAFAFNASFDELFPAEVTVRTIAHRGGGNEGPENTVAGLRTAAALGAWGSEIDIQRTLDDHYVVNHDASFKRVSGDARKPGEMTLAEVQELTVDGEPVATYEDMLEAAHDTGVVLFVELKGESADHQMADDAVRIAREYDMLDNCVFISLAYELIDYIEDTYAGAQTGYLAWASYGDTAGLNCDYLALEELSSTSDAIEAVHGQGKELFVWTVNDEDSQRHFLCSDADAIITDNVEQANEVREELEARSDIERIVDTLLVQL